LRDRNNSTLGLVGFLRGKGSIGYIENAMTGALLTLSKPQLEELKYKYSYVGFLCNGELTGNRIGNQFFYMEHGTKCNTELLMDKLKKVLFKKEGVFYYDFEVNKYRMYPIIFEYGSSLYSVKMFSETDPDHSNTVYIIHKLTSSEIERIEEEKKETVCQ